MEYEGEEIKGNVMPENIKVFFCILFQRTSFENFKLKLYNSFWNKLEENLNIEFKFFSNVSFIHLTHLFLIEGGFSWKPRCDGFSFGALWYW